VAMVLVRELVETNEDSTLDATFGTSSINVDLLVEIRRLVEVVCAVLLDRLNLCCGCVDIIKVLGVLTGFIGKEALVDIWRFVVVVGAVLLVHVVVRSDSHNLCCGCVVNI